MSDPIIIAVDGPAASGKGTLSRRLSSLYGLRYLDTGRLYRGVAWMLLSSDRDPRNASEAEEAAARFDASALESPELRTAEVGRAASLVAVHPGVRSALLEFQRSFGKPMPGAVIDGRDIGTVIFPDAPVKLYITASTEERARRRFEELRAQDSNLTMASMIEQIQRRDERDRGREVAPLRPANDAYLLDTTDMTIDQTFAAACRHIDRTLEAAGRAAQKGRA
ncbi:MAG: (d)CMP kinase [Parvularcula sp.]|jgi:cytidylate kinase|nr:(d)CMP kinase [Parvularcula sp.]